MLLLSKAIILAIFFSFSTGSSRRLIKSTSSVPKLDLKNIRDYENNGRIDSSSTETSSTDAPYVINVRYIYSIARRMEAHSKNPAKLTEIIWGIYSNLEPILGTEYLKPIPLHLAETENDHVTDTILSDMQAQYDTSYEVEEKSMLSARSREKFEHNVDITSVIGDLSSKQRLAVVVLVESIFTMDNSLSMISKELIKAVQDLLDKNFPYQEVEYAKMWKLSIKVDLLKQTHAIKTIKGAREYLAAVLEYLDNIDYSVLSKNEIKEFTNTYGYTIALEMLTDLFDGCKRYVKDHQPKNNL